MMQVPKTLHRSKGFTLLEVMVAVAILAVASSAVYFSNTEALATQVKLEEQTIAQWILANQSNVEKIVSRLEDTGSPLLRRAISGPQQIEFAGLDWEIASYRLPSESPKVRRMQWEVFRIVEGKRIGPIRSYQAVIGTNP